MVRAGHQQLHRDVGLEAAEGAQTSCRAKQEELHRPVPVEHTEGKPMDPARLPAQQDQHAAPAIARLLRHLEKRSSSSDFGMSTCKPRGALADKHSCN